MKPNDIQNYLIADKKYNLGVMYYNGKNGVSPNYLKAFQLFQEAIKITEHPDALVFIGSMYINGQGVKKDISHGLNLLNQSAQKYMSKKAHNVLSQVYEKGIGVKPNQQLAEAHKYASAKEITKTDGAIELVQNYYLANFYKEANIYSKFALEDKDVLAILGFMAYNGNLDGEPDYEVAYKWFEKSEKKGYEDGAYMMALSMEKGHLPYGFSRIPTLLDIARKRGNKRAAEKLSSWTLVLFRTGNYEEALKYAKATQDHPISKGVICMAYYSGKGCPKDMKKAIRYATDNCNNPICMSILGLDKLLGIVQAKNTKAGIQLLCKSSLNWNQSSIILGEYFKKRYPLLAYYFFNKVRDTEELAEKEAKSIEQKIKKEAIEYFTHYAEHKIESALNDTATEFSIALGKMFINTDSELCEDSIREYMNLIFDVQSFDIEDSLLWTALDNTLDNLFD